MSITVVSQDNDEKVPQKRTQASSRSIQVHESNEKGYPLEGDVTVFEAGDGDEALQLVGAERTSEFSEEYNAKLRRKLDFVIPPICAAVYFTQFLDKTALNYASIMELPITGLKYNLITMSFYLGFFVWEFPTVFIAQKLRLAKYLGCNVIVWGAILMLQASTTNFGAFFAIRFFLGMCESCVTPVLVLLVSMFYKKDEQARRVSWFVVMNGLSQAFGGFLAYGISFETRIVPYKVIFILLGGLAIAVGICVLIWLPDSPVHAKMLTKEERVAALERVRNDQGGTENHKFKRDQVIEALLDVRTWLIVLTTVLTSIPNGGLSSFSNIIIKGFGYTSKQTLILSTPGGLVTALTTLLCGWYSDTKNERMMPIIFSLIPTIVGSALLIGLNDGGHKGVLLFAVYIVTTSGSALSSVYAYNASNTSGHTKKVTINAMTLATTSIGNAIGTEIFQPKDAPAYIPGKIAIMVVITVQIAVSLLLRGINLRLNAKKRAALQAEKEKHGWSDADVQKERERHAFADLTDRQNMFFVYTA